MHLVRVNDWKWRKEFFIVLTAFKTIAGVISNISKFTTFWATFEAVKSASTSKDDVGFKMDAKCLAKKSHGLSYQKPLYSERTGFFFYCLQSSRKISGSDVNQTELLRHALGREQLCLFCVSNDSRIVIFNTSHVRQPCNLNGRYRQLSLHLKRLTSYEIRDTRE